ncbi:MAG: gliding motility-associated C-terminal domain-containing protein, partial [Saprospiraceae bacterium]|nr:gliding motility-associated C-terminal domain-containing protein [Saprospiraceae bacterium]
MCGDSNGIIALDAQTGIGPFTYSVGLGLSTENVFHNLSPGIHQVLVQDADGCIFEDSVLVSPSNAILLDPLVAMTSCGLENGRIQINADGGTGGLTYSIADSFGIQQTFDLLPPDIYIVQVKDAEDCIEQSVVEVLASTNPILAADIDPTHCGLDNGKIDMHTSFGEAPYSYHVDGIQMDTGSIQSLVSATYKLMVRDVHNCVDSTTVVIEASTAPQLTFLSQPASCYQENGTIAMTGTSGMAPYQYSIGNGFFTDSVFMEVDSGVYHIMLRDSDNCIDSVSMLVAYDDQFQKPELADQGAVCSEDAAILDIGLPSAPNIVWTRNGTPLTGENEPVLSTMDPGIYKVVVSYHEGCVLSDSSNIIVHNKPEQPWSDQATICRGEQFIIDQSKENYIYEWSNDSVGDKVAFEVSGVYQLKVLNEYGCFIDREIAMEVVQPVELTILNDVLQICEGESIDLNLAGADVYLWITEDSSISDVHVSSPAVSPATDASYLVIGMNQCFDDSIEFSVSIFEDVTLVTPDTLVIEGSPLQLDVLGALEANWSSDHELECANCTSTLLRPVDSENVLVEYIDENGCAREASIGIDVTPLQDIFPRLVNVITPNHDGMNDVLIFEGMETFRGAKLEIFNQQGLKLFEDREYGNDWEGTYQGKVLPEGVYFYMISLLLDDRVFHFDSDLTIVRD